MAISIHAPHTGRDRKSDFQGGHSQNFNPRAPYGARLFRQDDQALGIGISIHAPHTGRDLTMLGKMTARATFQSTRPIRGATRFIFGGNYHATNFNPRAPYGARRNTRKCCSGRKKFQSTRPIRGATTSFRRLSILIKFQSTRPIRGATCPCFRGFCGAGYFNPRAPYGARRFCFWRGAIDHIISIHAPHTGRDCTAMAI